MSRARRLAIVLVLNLGLIVALVIVGLAAHSLAVLAAGADYLADAGAIGVSLLAIWLAARPPTAARPGGYPDATTIAALVNAGWLLALNIAVIAAAIGRLAAGTHRVDGRPVLIVSAIAAAVMLAGALVLRGEPDDEGQEDDADDDGPEDEPHDDDGQEDGHDDGPEDLNVKAVLLDTAADAAAAAGVAVTGAIILGAGGWYWLDPAVALVIAVVVGYHAQKLVRRITAVLRSSRSARAGRPGDHAGGTVAS